MFWLPYLAGVATIPFVIALVVCVLAIIDALTNSRTGYSCGVGDCDAKFNMQHDGSSWLAQRRARRHARTQHPGEPARRLIGFTRGMDRMRLRRTQRAFAGNVPSWLTRLLDHAAEGPLIGTVTWAIAYRVAAHRGYGAWGDPRRDNRSYPAITRSPTTQRKVDQ